MLAPSGRNYDEFRKHVLEAALPLLDQARKMCLSLGENVAEDVRMHRVVYGKSVSFRWFADVEPQEDWLVIKIQRSRKEEPQTVKVMDADQLAKLGPELCDAYENIR